MRWLKHVVSVGLLLAAMAIAVGTAFSDHSSEYGKVALPSGGVIHLPKGTVTVYEREGVSSLAFQVVPVSGGNPIPVKSAGGSIAATGVSRSEIIGEHNAVGKLDVPSSGDYRVASATNVAAGSATLEFGTNTAAALAAKWKLLAGLVGAAFLIALIPTPRHKRHRKDEPGSSTALPPAPHRAPYVG